MKSRAIGLIRRNIVFMAALAAVLFFRWRCDLYCVQTGSMEPEIQVGAVVVVDAHAAPGEGDIGAYQLGPSTIIHRVISVSGDGYEFKGDANPSADPAMVGEGQIRGRVLLTLNMLAPVTRGIGLAGNM